MGKVEPRRVHPGSPHPHITDADITFTEAQLAAAAIEFQRCCPFYGGTYTHDAQRILRAMNKEAA
ncbi:hypothetical protein GS889_14295 [Rhodococcus hoagii]|nr:hypothetical protein [Prescottella equi]